MGLEEAAELTWLIRAGVIVVTAVSEETTGVDGFPNSGGEVSIFNGAGGAPYGVFDCQEPLGGL